VVILVIWVVEEVEQFYTDKIYLFQHVLFQQVFGYTSPKTGENTSGFGATILGGGSST
jgi:hypothetical protein